MCHFFLNFFYDMSIMTKNNSNIHSDFSNLKKEREREREFLITIENNIMK